MPAFSHLRTPTIVQKWRIAIIAAVQQLNNLAMQNYPPPLSTPKKMNNCQLKKKKEKKEKQKEKEEDLLTGHNS